MNDTEIINESKKNNDSEIEWKVLQKLTISDITQIILFVLTGTYVLGGILLWQYLDSIGLRSEFLFFISSNNLIFSFTTIGSFLTLFITFYLLYVPSLLKDVHRINGVLEIQKKRNCVIIANFILFFVPIFLMIATSMVTESNFGIMCVYVLTSIVLGYGYSFYITGKVMGKDVENQIENHKKAIPYSLLVFFITLISVFPLFLMMQITKRLVEGDLVSCVVLMFMFGFYSIIAAFLSMVDSHKQYIKAVFFLLLCSIIFVGNFSNVAVTSAKVTGIGAYCTDIFLKKGTHVSSVLLSKGIAKPESPLVLKGVYVLLHKDKSQYIISKDSRGIDGQRIFETDITDVGLDQDCHGAAVGDKGS